MTSWPMAFWMHLFGEIVDDFEIDVRFEQRGAHLAHGLADVLFADAAAAGEAAEYAGEFIGKCVEHTGVF